MHEHQCLGKRPTAANPFLDCRRKQCWVHIPGGFITIDENGTGPLVNDRVYRSAKRVGAHKHLIALPYSGKYKREVQRACARRHGQGMAAVGLLDKLPLERIDVWTD